jgi:hypothetical protein
MGILIKKDVEFGAMTPAGARILDALKRIARTVSFDVMITSARDGVHSGPTDPHKLGEAFDLRTNTLTSEHKHLLLSLLQQDLYGDTTWGTRRFYAFLESPGTPNEHIHVQRRMGTTYTTYDYLANL